MKSHASLMLPSKINTHCTSPSVQPSGTGERDLQVEKPGIADYLVYDYEIDSYDFDVLAPYTDSISNNSKTFARAIAEQLTVMTTGDFRKYKVLFSGTALHRAIYTRQASLPAKPHGPRPWRETSSLSTAPKVHRPLLETGEQRPWSRPRSILWLASLARRACNTLSVTNTFLFLLSLISRHWKGSAR